MKKVTKKYEVYNFDELDEKIKEKLIKKEIEYQCEAYCESFLYNDMLDETQRILHNTFKDSKIEDIDINYDFSYSQGSGACCSFNIYLEDVNKKLKIFTDKELEIFKNYGSLMKIIHNDNFYCHEKTFVIDDMNLYYSIDYALQCEEITENKYNKLEQKITKLFDELKELLTTINSELAKYGYSLIENEDNFKSGAIDFLQEQEYLKDGAVFNV